MYALGWGSIYGDGVIMLTGAICMNDGVMRMTEVGCIEDGVTLRNDRGHMVDGHPHKPKKRRGRQHSVPDSHCKIVKLGKLPPKCNKDSFQVWLRNLPQLITEFLINFCHDGEGSMG